MVTLRIWHPSRTNGHGPGFASLNILSPSGASYLSVRVFKPGEKRPIGSKTATLADDIKAEGGDTPHIWSFTNLDEGRMMRVWDQLKGLVAAQWKSDTTENSFHFCDMLLAAGQGYVVEAISPDSLSDRAKGALHLATLATTYSALTANAENYLKVKHW